MARPDWLPDHVVLGETCRFKSRHAPKGKFGRYCGAIAHTPEGRPYRCTLAPGHEGDVHAAGFFGRTFVFAWSDDPDDHEDGNWPAMDPKLLNAMGKTLEEMTGTCPACGGLVWTEAERCGHCGQELD